VLVVVIVVTVGNNLGQEILGTNPAAPLLLQAVVVVVVIAETRCLG
jgi:hypothetical protein